MSKNERREFPHAAVVGGSTIVASPAAAIEADGHSGAAKRLTPPMAHPSMAANADRSFATRKGQPPAHQPINANPSAGRPTRAPEIHSGAMGRRSTSNGDTPGLGGSTAAGHSVAQGDAILAEGFAKANNRLPTETAHHSTTTGDIIADVEKTLG